MTGRLRTTLYVVAGWLTLMGTLFLFAPRVAETVLKAALPDAGLNMLYGQVTLTFAYVAFMAARESEAASRLSRAVMTLTAGHVLVFGYQLLTGMMDFAQVGPPLIINFVFTVLLYLFRK